MKKISILLSFIMIVSLCAGCSDTPEVSDIRVTENQFWNGVITNTESDVYDETHNLTRFVNNSSNQYVQCVGIKDYNVYILYDFIDYATAKAEMLTMFKKWEKVNDAKLETVETDAGIFYLMSGYNGEYTVCFPSTTTMILGIGNQEDIETIIHNLENILSSSDSEYDRSLLQILPKQEKEGL